MTISERKHGSVTIVQAQGRLDAGSAPETEKRLTALAAAGARQVVLDLSGVEYISSAGLRVLLGAAKRLQQAQGKLVLASPLPQARQVLDMAGFSALIPVFDTAAAATACLAPPAVLERPERAPVSLVEEVYLLALDDQRGVIKPTLLPILDCALAGALLMELALCGRIDTDATGLRVTSSEPTGDALLDDALRELQRQPEPQPTSYWVEAFTETARHLQDQALTRLLAKGVLKQEDRRLLWVFAVRRYPVMDDREVKEVRTRLRELIQSDDIPDPRDVVLLNLANACRLLDDLLAPPERERLQPRIAALARLDLIGQEMARLIRSIELTMVTATMIY
jgi:anti-anti-sigma factor